MTCNHLKYRFLKLLFAFLNCLWLVNVQCHSRFRRPPKVFFADSILGLCESRALSFAKTERALTKELGCEESSNLFLFLSKPVFRSRRSQKLLQSKLPWNRLLAPLQCYEVQKDEMKVFGLCKFINSIDILTVEQIDDE